MKYFLVCISFCSFLYSYSISIKNSNNNCNYTYSLYLYMRIDENIVLEYIASLARYHILYSSTIIIVLIYIALYIFITSKKTFIRNEET